MAGLAIRWIGKGDKFNLPIRLQLQHSDGFPDVHY